MGCCGERPGHRPPLSGAQMEVGPTSLSLASSPVIAEGGRVAAGPPGRVCSETDPEPWPRTWRSCFSLCHVGGPAACVKAPVPAGPPRPHRT